MDAHFWHQRWENKQIGFHQSEINAMLVDQLPTLSLPDNSRIFVPLCGKSRDIGWLLTQGHRVVGVELSPLAIEQLFSELGVKPELSTVGNLKHYGAVNIDIFVGDIFDLTADLMGPVDAVYDRAALVALPSELRQKYSSHVYDITKATPQLLICFEYDQTAMAGPPFSIDKDELVRVYSASYNLAALASAPVTGGLKGICPAQETAWLLRKR
jgi:thiopurine S-methyltransferase